MAAVTERLLDDDVASSKRWAVEFELLEAFGGPAQQARSDQVDEPANVNGRHELPGPPEGMSAEDGPVGQGAFDRRIRRSPVESEPERPLCCEIVLRLHRDEPRYELVRLLEIVARNLLNAE